MPYRPDPDERDDTISATVHNYRVGEFSRMRAEAALVACGLNATEIAEKLEPLRREAFANFIKRREK